jgi:FkbM family methyltransferase
MLFFATLAMLQVAPQHRYVGYEPNTAAISRITTRFADLDRTTVRVVAAAVGVTDGYVSLHRHPWLRYDRSAAVSQHVRPRRRTGTLIVPSTTIDTDCAQPVDLVKIDVEGAELEVLLGMVNTLAQWRPAVICEVLFRDRNADIEHYLAHNRRLNEFLVAHDYLVHQVRKVVPGLVRLEAIPTATWSWRNSQSCDYVFLPRETVLHPSSSALGSV